MKSFQEDVTKIEKNKLTTLKKDIEQIKKLAPNKEDNNLLIQNLNTIFTLYQARIIRVNENLQYFENLKKNFRKIGLLMVP